MIKQIAVVEEIENIFTDYSMAALYKEAASLWIKNATQDGVPLIERINIILLASGSDLQISASSDSDEIFNALVIVKEFFDETGRGDNAIEEILFVLNLVNPGYFNAISGFVGNDEISSVAVPFR